MMEISFKKLCIYLIRMWWLFVAVAIFGGIVGFIFAESKEETFRVECRVKVAYTVQTDKENASISGTQDYWISNVLEILRNPDFLQKQFKAAGADKLIGKETNKDTADYVKVVRRGSSDFLDISVETNDQQTSMSIANKILENIDVEMERIYGDRAGDVVSVVKLDETPRYVEESVDRRITYTLIGIVVGAVVLAVVLVCVRLFDNRIYDSEEISERYKADFLGSLRGGNRS